MQAQQRCKRTIQSISNTSFTSTFASTFSTTSSTRIFSFIYEFLRILQVILDEFSSSAKYLLAVASGRIAVVGTKVFELPPLSIVRSNRLPRLNIKLGISPLCLQIYFCINNRLSVVLRLQAYLQIWLDPQIAGVTPGGDSPDCLHSPPRSAKFLKCKARSASCLINHTVSS